MATNPETSTLTTPTDRSLHVERVFDAPRDCVWRAHTEPGLVARWWGRGHELDVERFEVERGGHWRVVEHSPGGLDGFEGRYRDVIAPERIVRTFEWDGMPGYVSIEDTRFEDLGGRRTRLVTDVLFHTAEERDGMLGAGMKAGMDESFAALDVLLATLC
jgi:uncharacterized protein YndB with AHSA1/START domain